MALFSSFNVGVNGMLAQSTKINVISDNISNLNTVGYKQSTTNFYELVTGLTLATYSPGGARADTVSHTNDQGEVLPTTINTNLAVNGNGFFAVKREPNATEVFYTRDGTFEPDLDGNLVNQQGFFLQGWVLDRFGELDPGLDQTSVSAGTAIGAFQTVNVSTLTQQPVPTTDVTLRGNLNADQTAYAGTPAYDSTDVTANMSSGVISPNFENPIYIVDSNGVAHQFQVAFLKTAPNTWQVEVYAQNPSEIVTAGDGQVAAGTLTFNGDGTLNSIGAGLQAPLNISWTNGAASNTVNVSWGTAGPIFGTPGAVVVGRADGISQFASSYTQDFRSNGTTGSQLDEISISENGTVTGSFMNGNVQGLYRIPVANFINPDELSSVDGQAYRLGIDSAEPTFLQFGSANNILSTSAVETSNVDLSAQLTDLIIAQRAYQFNSRVASVTETMLGDLTTMGAT